MRLIDDDNGLTVTLTYDADGFPTVDIETGGNFVGPDDRPAVAVALNGTTIHTMFSREL